MANATMPPIADAGAHIKLLAVLEARRRSYYWSAWGQIALGLALTLFIPVLIALFCLHTAGFGVSLLVSVIIVVPVAYVWEWYTQGQFLMNQLRALQGGGIWRWEARADVAEWEIILCVPRLVFSGIAHLRAAAFITGANPDRAAQILQILLSQPAGIFTAQLEAGSRDKLEFTASMAYLMFYDWIGVAKEGHKAWLDSETREELNRSAIIPP